MTDLEQLAIRTLLASFPGAQVPDWLRKRLGDGLGGVCLFGRNLTGHASIPALIEDVHDAGPRALTTLDEEGGDVTRLYYRVGSPHAGHAVLGAADDLDLTQAVAHDIGIQLRRAGADLDFAPVADVNSNPRNPVIGVRSFGADPELVARHTVAWVRGLQDAGVGACLKHFPGHGDTMDDSHLALPVVDASVEVLRRRELVPFRAGISAGAAAVMTSHVVVRGLDPGEPATFSPAVLAVLRKPKSEGGLGFDGLLVSDALDMRGASAGIGIPAAAVRALAAGVDLLCLGGVLNDDEVQTVTDEIVGAVRAGQLSEGRLAEAARRVDAAVDTLSTLRRNAGRPDSQRAETAGDSAARRALRVNGSFESLAGAQVLRFVTEPNQAVGHAPWGLPPDGLVLAGGTAHNVQEGEALPDLDGRPVVALVRGAQRYAWVQEALAALAERRPDLVVVELGWPGPDPLPGQGSVYTYGASAASARAVDALLANGSG